MKGAIENCCRAEQEIMKKVREAYENDVAAMSVSVRWHCLRVLGVESGPWRQVKVIALEELNPKLHLQPSLNLAKAAAGRFCSHISQDTVRSRFPEAGRGHWILQN